MKWFFQYLSFPCLLLLLQACSNNSKPLTHHSQNDTLLPPYIIPIDSLKQVITLLDKAPKPKIIPFPQPGRGSFDETIDSINIIPQDIGRVLLNLYNNAFYAVNEKKKKLQENYEPTVSVSTKRVNSKIEVRVRDNGNGIPQKVLDKIFQPFFTTKPTGQGTGLGLSLSYDIIKAHGGEIKVETREGEGSVFITQLSIV